METPAKPRSAKQRSAASRIASRVDGGSGAGAAAARALMGAAYPNKRSFVNEPSGATWTSSYCRALLFASDAMTLAPVPKASRTTANRGGRSARSGTGAQSTRVDSLPPAASGARAPSAGDQRASRRGPPRRPTSEADPETGHDAVVVVERHHRGLRRTLIVQLDADARVERPGHARLGPPAERERRPAE